MTIALMTICYVLARVIEAKRDAIDFDAGDKPLGFWWHFCKYPQQALIFAAGFLAFLVTIDYGWWWIAVMIAAGWGAFEIALYLFRRKMYGGDWI